MNRSEEIMTVLGEECAEVIVELSKVKRFGMTEENVTRLKKEMSDLQCMLNLMEEFTVVTYRPTEKISQMAQKREKLKKFSKIFDSNS